MNGSNCAEKMQANPQTDAQPISACEEAYTRLRIEQENVAAAFGRLVERLATVLRDETSITGKGACEPETAPMSEMHGRFLAAGVRERDMVGRINAITDRLTI